MAVRLPAINVGRFIRTDIAPLIPGGSEVAERVNGVIKDVKAGVASGQDIMTATKAAVTEVNVAEKQKQYVTLALIGGGLLLLFIMFRRR